jgi:glucose/arabinose dehydrogenase
MLLGKILRIRPIQTSTRPYQIPSTNPFVGKTGRDEIYAYGLRNPWRFSLDGSSLFIGDVGQSAWEEVDGRSIAAASGMNFGWPKYEGKVVYDATKPEPTPARFPVFVYSHNSGCAIIGGFVVRDPQLPGLNGHYIYGDLCSGNVRSFIPDIAQQKVTFDAPTGITIPALTTFGRGVNGQLYAAGNGVVYRIEP